MESADGDGRRLRRDEGTNRLPDLEELLRRCRRGDGLAWEALVRRYQSRIYSLAWHYLRDREEARDAAQEVFVRIYQKRRSWKPEAGFVAWMFTIARNHCVDRLRRRRLRPGAPLPEEGGPGEPASPQAGPEETALADARRRLLYRALDGLGDRSREIILLKDIQGMEFHEISRMLRLPLGTVKSRSHRARIELARRILALDPSYER